MNAPAPAHVPAPVSAQQRKWPRVLALLVVVAVLLALTAATFVLSYDGVRAVALEAGVSTSLARFYPGVLDAALVIACAAALLLRDGKWWARWYAWFAVIVIVAVAGGTDAVHAMNVALPHKQTEGVVAAAPWVLVLLAFSLWITILRQSRNAHRPVPEAGDAPVPEPAAASVPGAPAVIAPAPQSPPEVEPEPNVVDLVPFSEPAPETPESAAEPEPESAPEETAPEPTIPVPMLSAPVDLAPIDTTPDSLDETAPDEVVPEEAVPDEVVPEEAASEESVPEETAPVMEAEPAGQAETDAAEPPAEEAEAAPEIDSTAEPELRAEPAPPAAAPEDERGETSEEEASEEEEPQDEQPQEPAVASKAPTAAKSSPRPLDYWDIDEDEKTDHETPADSGSPAEVHHTLDDPAPQTSASVPVTRFRRVRSTPVRPEEEETDENP